jgi:hypothetical protein
MSRHALGVLPLCGCYFGTRSMDDTNLYYTSILARFAVEAPNKIYDKWINIQPVIGLDHMFLEAYYSEDPARSVA